MKKIDKIIVWSFVLSPVILISSFVVYSAIFDEPLEEIVMKEDLSSHFYGVIDTLYFNRRDHNTKYAVLSNHYNYPIFTDWERYLEKGDSLAKDRNSFQVRIFKIRGDTIVLDYRNTYKEEVRKKLGI